MTDKPENSITLAIESAVSGGGISLLRGESEIASWVSDGGVSRAEDLLPNIAGLLEKTSICKEELTRLAVSTGPGSYTGIRIGIATALGLKNALNIPCNGVLVTKAMRIMSSDENFITAVPMGKTDVCRQDLVQEVPDLTIYDTFLDFLRSNPTIHVIAERSLYLRLIESKVAVNSLIDAGPNLAYYVGLAALRDPGNETLEPLFIKATQ